MPEYDFRTLSPTDFEYLIGDVLNADLGLRLHSYPEGRDQGIDLREATAGGHTTIVQCKHYRKSSPATFLAAVRKEAKKPALRVADRYIFVTSHDLSAAREDEVAGILGIPHGDVWGPRAINDALGRNPDVERRHFKLWLSSTAALDAILNAGRWCRTDALLHEVARRARYWVETPAYAAVRDILSAEGVCLVAGIPGIGKTFLADMIMLAAADEGWQVVDIADGGIEDAWAAARPETRQLFYYDDFLGQAELLITATAEAPSLVRFVSYVRAHRDHKRLILTSREHVLQQASVAISDPLRRLVGDPARYTVALTAYDAPVRAEILANHLHFSDLPDAEREQLEIDNRVLGIAAHPAYYPRLVEAITATRSLAHATADQVLDEMLRALDHPEEVWAVSFDALGPLAQDIALTLATFPVRPVPLAELRLPAAPSGCTARDWRTAIKSLEPTWIRVTDDEERAAVFANPGCRDYLLGRLDDPDLAAEWAGRSRRLRQLVSITESAGLFGLDGPRGTRPALARALLDRSAELTSLVEKCAEGSPDLRTLRDAAALLSVYGTAETSGWLADRVAGLEGPVPTGDGLALAVWLSKLPAAGVRRLLVSALASARTSRDLDAYEALPADLRTPDVHEIACRRAASIIDAELAALARESDPGVIRESALELRQRAEWYGHDVQVNPLLDRADDLSNLT